MKIKSKITAWLTVILMLLVQVPFPVFAEETTSGTTNTLTPDTLENGAEDIKWYQSFTYNGSADIDSVKIIEGSLPENVYLNSPSYTWFSISGTPTTMGEYSFTIEVKNKNNEVLTKKYTLTIERDFPLEIVTNNLDRGYVGSEYSDNVYLSYNRKTKNKWSLEDADGNVLPEGLTINEGTGDISWENPQAGKYNLKITVTRKEQTTSKVLKLIIEDEGGCKHTNTQKTPGKTATCKQNGTRDYWYCNDCERYFYDEQCTDGSEYLGNIYTTAFHSDDNNDGKCDTCQKVMPIFKKVTNENEITSCGMYLAVAKIDDKYYTLKAPGKGYSDVVEAVEIVKEDDGTFSYPNSDTGVMILKTEFAAACGELDAGKPRYGIGTTIGGIPYSLSSDDYSGSIYMYSYEKSKYGYRMKLTDEENAEIASVYAEYWGDSGSGKGGNSGILTAFKGVEDSATKRFFSFATKEAYESEGLYTDLSSYPIELYKLTYVGDADGQSYSLSDGLSKVTIDNKVTILDSAANKAASTVGGIGEAVKPSYVKSVISGQNKVTGDVSVTTYADISLTSGETVANEWGGTNISSLVYEVVPKIEVKAKNSDATYTQTIGDENFDGSKIALTLCVGYMNPAQIIHSKTDGTNEYFYKETSKDLKAGQKTFSIDDGEGNGNFVTFEIDSFSEIKILATAAPEEHSTKTTVSGNGSKFTVKGNNIDGCTVILALYNNENKLVNCQTAVYNGSPISFTVAKSNYTSAKVMTWKNLTTMSPVTKAEIVDLEQ